MVKEGDTPPGGAGAVEVPNLAKATTKMGIKVEETTTTTIGRDMAGCLVLKLKRTARTAISGMSLPDDLKRIVLIPGSLENGTRIRRTRRIRRILGRSPAAESEQ